MSNVNRLSQVKSVPASGSDNAEIGTVCIIPPGKQTKIYSFRSRVRTGSGSGDTVELVASNATSTVLAEIDTNTAGINKDTSTTFPVEVVNSGTTDIALVLLLNGASGSTVDAEVITVCDDPGAN